jgi:Ca2+-dependent lipid-binding protein
MPATLTVHIQEAKGLPVMDTGSNSTDAYVELRLGKKYFKKTTTAMHTLDPVWDEVLCITLGQINYPIPLTPLRC